MKYFLIFSALMLSFHSNAQTEKITVKGNYFFNNYTISETPSKNHVQKNILTDTMVKEFNFLKENINQQYVVSVQSIKANIVYFKYWSFNGNAAKEAKFNGFNNELIYAVPEEDFKAMMSTYYNRVDWQVGFFTVPFKLRFSDFSFNSDINIGANLSAKIRRSRYAKEGISFQPLLGIGITKINLDDSNSKAVNAITANAFTFNTGIILNITESINFGIFYGIDFLESKDNTINDWKHNGNGWLGLGFNITFSEGNKNNDKPSGN